MALIKLKFKEITFENRHLKVILFPSQRDERKRNDNGDARQNKNASNESTYAPQFQALAI